MSFSFTGQKKKEKILIIALVLVLLATGFNVYNIFFQEKKDGIIITTQSSFQQKEIRVDFSVFEMPVLNYLSDDYLDILSEEEENFGKKDLFKN